MNANTKALAVAGGAFAVVWLASNATTAKRAVGKVVPPYITLAQRAALAELEAPILGFAPQTRDSQISTRWLELNRAAIASRGASARPHLAAWSKDDLLAIIDRFLAAVEEGALVGAPVGQDHEVYLLWPHQRFDPRDVWNALWTTLDESDLTELTDLGRAVAQVRASRRGLVSGFYSSPEDLLYVTLTIGTLAAEMDGAGYIVSGKPEQPTVSEGIAYALSKSLEFVADTTSDIVGWTTKLAVDALGKSAGVIVSSPVFWAAGFGLIAWRVLR